MKQKISAKYGVKGGESKLTLDLPEAFKKNST